MGDELLLSPHSSTPMYVQIVEQVVAKVMAGEWQAGAPLPSREYRWGANAANPCCANLRVASRYHSSHPGMW